MTVLQNVCNCIHLHTQEILELLEFKSGITSIGVMRIRQTMHLVQPLPYSCTTDSYTML